MNSLGPIQKTLVQALSLALIMTAPLLLAKSIMKPHVSPTERQQNQHHQSTHSNTDNTETSADPQD